MRDIMIALADAIGLDYKSRRVSGFEVHCHVGEAPRVVVHEALISSGDVTRPSMEMMLVPKPAVTLDEKCAAAMARVQAFIDSRAAEIIYSFKRESHKAA